jgi:alpha-beta hydrolase superfamily lysophospholipase
VLLVHGLSDHSGRYEHVGEQFAAAGLDTWAYDLRGNGGSGGRRGHVERWSQLHDDLAERLRAVRQAAGDRPVVHGLDDGLVPAKASEILATLPNAERRTYPGLRHELHNEPEGPAILDEVIAWIRERATIEAQPNIASGERLVR